MEEKHHILSYRAQGLVLVALLILTTISIVITEIDLGTYAVVGALLFAGIKSYLVLSYYMHLRFDQKVFSLFVGLVVLVFIIVLVITFLDYNFR